jgi:hypothetical protein
VEPLAIAAVILLLLLIFTVAAISKRKAPASDTRVSASSTHARIEPQASPTRPVVVPEVAVTNGPAKPTRKRRTPRVVEITVETPFGPVTLKKPRRPATALVVALGQSEDHLDWYYNVYRREYLERAVANLKAYQKGKKDRSSWNDSYFEFLQDTPMLLANLSAERQHALCENRGKIQRGEVAVLGTYPTLEQAREAARWLAKEKEATLNAGWLQVHVVEMPTQA